MREPPAGMSGDRPTSPRFAHLGRYAQSRPGRKLPSYIKSVPGGLMRATGRQGEGRAPADGAGILLWNMQL